MDTVPVVQKVVAYVVHDRRVAVFVHLDDVEPVYESGLQVPAGTVHHGEDPRDAVLREAFEETGLPGLRVVSHLGTADYDMRPYAEALHHRHFFELTVDGEVAAEWDHIETDGGTGVPRPFRYRWLPMGQGHALAAGLGAMLGRITS